MCSSHGRSTSWIISFYNTFSTTEYPLIKSDHSSINVCRKALVFNMTMNDDYEKLWFRTNETSAQQHPTTKYHSTVNVQYQKKKKKEERIKCITVQLCRWTDMWESRSCHLWLAHWFINKTRLKAGLKVWVWLVCSYKYKINNHTYI